MPLTGTPPLLLVDVFTRTAGLGNRAAVVLDAGGMTVSEMQAMAARSPAHEAAFGLPSLSPDDYDLEVRYFSRTRELPLCGHATLAFHHARAQVLGLGPQRLKVRTGAGILPIDLVPSRGGIRVVMTQARPQVLRRLSVRQTREVCSALGISAQAMVDSLPPEIVTTGHAKLMLAVSTREALHGAAPNRTRLIELSEQLGIPGYFVFTLDAAAPDLLYHGRMFGPATGVDEDPVTGNANGPAGVFLVRHKILEPPPVSDDDAEPRVLHYRAIQGEAMGRPGVIEVILSFSANEVAQVQVTGDALIV